MFRNKWSLMLVAMILLLSTACASSPTTAPAKTPTTSSQSLADVTNILQSVVQQGQVNGISLIIIKGGAVVYQQAFGSYTLSTRVPIASASKMPSVSAFMTLVDQHKLSLDDHVAKYLSFWPSDKSAITIRQLLSHTSGLPAQASCLNDVNTTLDQCVRQIASLPLLATPGTAFIYGGADYQVIGRIAEIVSGQSWVQFFQQHIGTPCNLASFDYASQTNPRIAGDALSNLQDYAKLLALHLSGGLCGSTRVLAASSVAMMQTDQVGTKHIQSSPFKDDRHYGLAWWLDPSNSSPTREYSDPGAFGAIPWIDSQRGYGAFLLLRKNLAAGNSIWKQIKPLINTHIDHNTI